MSASAGHGASVRIESCGKTFADGTRALEPATLDISSGETLVLLGPSGCGKTTMLRIIAGLGGWPWIADMVGLLRRHPNLYCDTAAHRPRYLAQPGSGWEQLIQFGNTLLQDKIMVGLSRYLFDTSFEELIKEYQDLPIKEKVMEKWLYGNAATFFRMG